jgi:hypothetical protein
VGLRQGEFNRGGRVWDLGALRLAKPCSRMRRKRANLHGGLLGNEDIADLSNRHTPRGPEILDLQVIDQLQGVGVMLVRQNRSLMKALSMGAAIALSAVGAHAATLTVLGQDDLYNANGVIFDGNAPQSINVAGLSSITFSVTGSVVLNTTSGDNFNDADGVGSAPSSSSNTGGNGIAGLTAPNAGYLTGAFEGATLTATPTALDFTGSGGTSFTSLSPALQQAFFIGDGLTGDGVGTTQTFYVPTGATTLYLGISDACGYNGSPSCYGDNDGSFTVTATGAAGGVPEPTTWSTMLLGFGAIGSAMRSFRRRSAALT